jgi:hypothetical protein
MDLYLSSLCSFIAYLTKMSVKKNLYCPVITAKQSLFRPGKTLTVSEGWGSQISRQSAHEGGKVINPTQRPPLPLRKYSWYSFLLEAELNPGTRDGPEGLCQWKIPMTPSGLEPATFRLVAQIAPNDWMKWKSWLNIFLGTGWRRSSTVSVICSLGSLRIQITSIITFS